MTVEIGVQDLREVGKVHREGFDLRPARSFVRTDGHEGVSDLRRRIRRYDSQAFDSPGQGHVERVDVVHKLKLKLLLTAIPEQGVLVLRLPQPYVIDPVGDTLKLGPLNRRTSPVLFRTEKPDLLGKWKDNMMELKPFRLVNRHNPDRFRIRRRADLRIGLLPSLKEAVHRIAVDSHIILHKIHQGLDVLRLGLEQLRLPALQNAQKLLAKVGQRQTGQSAHIDVQFSGKEGADRVILIPHRGEERHHLTGHSRGLQMQGIVRDHTHPVVHQVHGHVRPMPVAPHQYSDLPVSRPCLVNPVHGVQYPRHLLVLVAEDNLDASFRGVLRPHQLARVRVYLMNTETRPAANHTIEGQ